MKETERSKIKIEKQIKEWKPKTFFEKTSEEQKKLIVSLDAFKVSPKQF
jgi:ribosomal protein S21